MHDGMACDLFQGRGHGCESFKVQNSAIFNRANFVFMSKLPMLCGAVFV